LVGASPVLRGTGFSRPEKMQGLRPFWKELCSQEKERALPVLKGCKAYGLFGAGFICRRENVFGALSPIGAEEPFSERSSEPRCSFFSKPRRGVIS